MFLSSLRFRKKKLSFVGDLKMTQDEKTSQDKSSKTKHKKLDQEDSDKTTKGEILAGKKSEDNESPGLKVKASKAGSIEQETDEQQTERSASTEESNKVKTKTSSKKKFGLNLFRFGRNKEETAVSSDEGTQKGEVSEELKPKSSGKTQRTDQKKERDQSKFTSKSRQSDSQGAKSVQLEQEIAQKTKKLDAAKESSRRVKVEPLTKAQKLDEISEQVKSKSPVELQRTDQKVKEEKSKPLVKEQKKDSKDIKMDSTKKEANSQEKKSESVKKSEKTKSPTENQEPSSKSIKVDLKANSVKLEGLFAFKMSMTTFYSDKGKGIPVTALKYEPCRVSQIKSQEKEAYQAVQVAFKPQKNKRCSKALIGHLKSSGLKEGARFVREIRQKLPEKIELGQYLSIESLKKGDLVKISSVSKGRGFSGVMKRWNFAGGKASHGSKSHRRIGSIGQHTEPARVMPGRKMPGQYGFKQVSRLKVPVVEVLPEEGIIFVKGPVPGARNTLVSLMKVSHPPS